MNRFFFLQQRTPLIFTSTQTRNRLPSLQLGLLPKLCYSTQISPKDNQKMPLHLKLGIGSVIAGQISLITMLHMLDMQFPCGAACGWAVYSWIDLCKIIKNK